MSFLRRSLYWVIVAVAIASVILVVGMLFGAIGWGVLGPVLGSDEPRFAARLAYGADLGMRYARVWAGGLAFVLCFVKAHEGFSLRAWLRARFS